MTETARLAGLGKRFDTVEAVREVSLALPSGQSIALVGHNGAGKTTLMKLMLGLIRPSAGSVRVFGEDPASRGFAALRRRIGYLPENVSFDFALTGRETLAFYARLKREPVARIGALLGRVGLAAAADRRVGTYSKGMRQRLGLAQALLGQPKLLLLDEPTTGLDPEVRQGFYDIVAEMRDQGATVLLSSHALTELEGRAERVIIMNRGVVVADGSVAELRRLASLPIRLRLTAANADFTEAQPAWLDGMGSWRRLDGRVAEIACGPEDKMEVLRYATGDAGMVADVDILLPTLDELYAHFLRGQEAAQ